jgi:hypothetical protein
MLFGPKGKRILTGDDRAGLQGTGSTSLEESDCDCSSNSAWLPDNIEGRASGDVLVLSRRGYRVKASSLRKDGGSERQKGSRDERITHIERYSGRERGISEIQNYTLSRKSAATTTKVSEERSAAEEGN